MPVLTIRRRGVDDGISNNTKCCVIRYWLCVWLFGCIVLHLLAVKKQMISQRIPLKGGAEQDVFSAWRKVLCYTRRSGVCSAIKRQYAKRMRQVHKREVRDAIEA
jgi:hypothetical protein